MMVTASAPASALATETTDMGLESSSEPAAIGQATQEQAKQGQATQGQTNSTPEGEPSDNPAQQQVQQQVAPVETPDPAVTAAADAKEITVGTSVTLVKEDATLQTILSKPDTKAAEGESAWDVVKRVLDEAQKDKKLTYDAPQSYGHYAVSTITLPDGTSYSMTQDASGNWVWWQFLVNDAMSRKYLDEYVVKAGDRIELRFAKDGQAVNPENVEPDDQSKEPENLEAEWPTFTTGGNVTDAPTPTNVSVNWKTLVGYVTEPLIIDGKVYVATSSNTMGGGNQFANQLKLLRIDEKSGQIEASTPLAGTISYTARPTYSNGLIYIPLDGGRVQAINVSTMKTRWVSAAPETGGQASTSLKVLETEVMDYYGGSSLKDILFSGTTVFGKDGATSGTMLALDAITGTLEPSLTFKNEQAGFYWTNVARVNGLTVTGDMGGTLWAIKAGAYGPSTTSFALGAAVNADLAVYNSQIVVPTRDGMLHVVSVAEDGTMAEVVRKKILDGCKAGVTIVGDDAIVGGLAIGGEGSAVVVVDLKTLTVKQTITKADGETLPGNNLYFISVPVLVSQQDGKNICYFTMNYGENENGTYTSGGNAYWFELGEDEAHLLYEPSGDAVNVSDSPLVAGKDGALYYLNDSGNLVRLTQNKSGEDKRPELSFDEQSAKMISRSHVVTVTVSQEIPADATTLDLTSTLEDVLEFTGDAPEVAIDGTKTGEATVDGQTVRARLGLQASGDMAIVAQAESDGGDAATEAKTKTATLTYQAKVRDDANLSSYDKNGVYVVPVAAQTSTNEDSARTYSTSKSLKIAGGSSSSDDTSDKQATRTVTPTRATTTSSTTTRAATAKTADDSFQVTWLVIPAITIVAISLAMRFRNRED